SSDVLTLSFTGLAPGDFVRFRAGISADDLSTGYVQDYRTVLFDLNGGDDISNNSVVSVDFEHADGTTTLTDQMINYDMGGLTTATNMTFPGGPCFDHIVPFDMSGNGTIVPIPEPGSVVLLGLGPVGIVALRLRGRRAKK